MEGSLVFNTDLNSDLVKELWKSLKGNLLLRTKNWNRRHTVGAWKCNQWIQSIIIIRRWVQYCMKDCLLLLLLLSHFSCVRLCATPETAAHQAPPSLGFSRQEYWSGVPSPSPMHKSEKWKEVAQSCLAQSCLTLRDPMDCSPPGSSVHGIFQARVLEWGAITFSKRLPTRQK